MSDREDTARKFADAMGCEYDPGGESCHPLPSFATDGVYGLALPGPDAPLHEQMEFAGYVAETLGATGMRVEFWPDWGPTVVIEMPGRSRHTDYASDIAWAVMLAAIDVRMFG